MAEATASAAAPAADTAPTESAPAEGAEASAPEAVAKPAEKKSWRLKLPQGEIDVDDPEELYQLAQHGIGAAQSLQEAKREAAQAAEFRRRLKEDPLSLLRDPALGLDGRNLALTLLKEQMEEENLSPEQKEIREYKRKLKAFEDDQKKRAEEEARIKQEAELNEARKQMVAKIEKTIELTNLPKTDAVARRIAALELRNLELGLDLPSSQIAKLVEQEYLEEHTALVGKMDPKKLAKTFPGLADALRRANLEQLDAAPPASADSAEAQPEQVVKPRGAMPKKDGSISFLEAQRLIRERLKG